MVFQTTTFRKEVLSMREPDMGVGVGIRTPEVLRRHWGARGRSCLLWRRGVVYGDSAWWDAAPSLQTLCSETRTS